ncbi:bacterial regulatory s, gntR family protein [Burkholderia pseudomallei MSHR5596]|uniref:Bacterial regulatory s, gntR family protein n=1 Tax=Burkholderia pseudomallei TaxID=28450 RepID=A0AA40JJG9_BURPE|nr:bacterial regulatory s, gntR family protein [Burkholderia pseudomallei MSHR5596]KGX17042.1 bacterial regulatory s, gntR family protein [Burkholderia pseudomallei]
MGDSLKSYASAPKRVDQLEQVRILTEALEGATIESALPYTPQIVKILRGAIIGLKLMPSTPISEAAIAKVLGLSRTPVREALKDLSDQNLIDIFPQAGTMVAPIRLSLIAHENFVRHALESANLMDLAGTLTQEGKDRIRKELGHQEDAIEHGRIEVFFDHDEAMHKLFFELTGRLPVWETVQHSKQHLDRARHLLMKDEIGVCRRAFAQHLKIVDALFKEDREGLAGAVANHLSGIREYLLDRIDSDYADLVVE